MDASQSSAEQSTPKPVADGGTEEQGRSTVAYDTHRRLLDEKKKLQQKLEEYEAKQREIEEAEARKRGEYDKILKAREEELEKERKARMVLQETFVNGQKLNAVIEALGGQVEPKWYKLIDVSKVVVDPETGEVDAMTASRVAEELRKDWPEMVKRTPGMPSKAPEGSAGQTITYAEWLKLPSKEMKKYKPNQIID